MPQTALLWPSAMLARAHHCLAPIMHGQQSGRRGRASGLATAWGQVDHAILASRQNYRLSTVFGDLTPAHPGWLTTKLSGCAGARDPATSHRLGVRIVAWLGALVGLGVKLGYWSLAHLARAFLPSRWQLGDSDCLPLIKLEANPRAFRQHFLEAYLAEVHRFEHMERLTPTGSILSVEFLRQFAGDAPFIELLSHASDRQPLDRLAPDLGGWGLSTERRDAVAATWCQWMETLGCNDAGLWASTLASETTPLMALESFAWALPDASKKEPLFFAVDPASTGSVFFPSSVGAQFRSLYTLEHMVDTRGIKAAKLTSPATFRATFNIQNRDATVALSLNQNGAETTWEV